MCIQEYLSVVPPVNFGSESLDLYLDISTVTKPQVQVI
jgi:hypothetical protein